MGRKGLITGAAAVAAVAAVLTAPVAASTPGPCVGHDLAGTFSGVRGSAGAGNILYNLRLRNRSSRACFVSGLATLRLLDRAGKPLPTHVAAAHPGQLTAVRVLLRPGGYAAATARFSPDIPGVGEQVVGPCERTAYRARVTPPPGGGAVIVPIVPATPVCEHGSMVLSVLIAGKNGPATA